MLMLLQQYLPLAVLKHISIELLSFAWCKLQQCLPLAVCDEGCEAAEE